MPTSESSATTSVLGIGQPKRRKGLHVLIQAARILKDMRIPKVSTIAGAGDPGDRLERLIQELELYNEAGLAGTRLHENTREFLGNADVLALPYVLGDSDTRDGIPFVLMEFTSRQLPVVSTNIGGLPQLKEAAEERIFVDPEDPEALAAAIRDLARSPELRKRLGTAAAKKTDSDFNFKRSARQLAELFSPGCATP